MRYEYAYKWTIRGNASRRRKPVSVDVNGAKDLRIIDMKPDMRAKTGTFAVTTTKATDPGALRPVHQRPRLRTDDGDEIIVSRPIPFEVTGGPSQCEISWRSCRSLLQPLLRRRRHVPPRRRADPQ